MVIAVAGSGGKTTTIFEYASQCRKQGLRVLITTTTHMLMPERYTGRIGDVARSCAVLSADAAAIAGMLEAGGICVAGIPDMEDVGKMGPLPDAFYRECCEAADVVLVEADGSRGLPAKYPAPHEPVIPENAEEIWILCGLSAIGKTMGESVHRAEMAAECLGVRLETVITPALLTRLVRGGYQEPLRLRYPDKKQRILCCQADTLYLKAVGSLLEAGQDPGLLHPTWFDGSPHLVIFGAGHVGRSLYEIARVLQYRVTVMDDREEFADPAFFREANVICGDFGRIAEQLPEEKDCYYAVLTRGHQWDSVCVKAVLRHKYGFGYLGMIGSRIKVKKTLEQLEREGFTETDIARIYAPIGLPLGGQTPSEIAVSIAAQIIQIRNVSSCVTAPEEIQMLDRIRDLSGTLAVIIEKHGSAPRGVGSMMFLPDRIYGTSPNPRELQTDTRSESGISPAAPAGSQERSVCLTGTIGGGSIEFNAVKRMEEINRNADIWSRPPEVDIVDYLVSDAEGATLGMICGGSVKVLYIRIDSRYYPL